MVAFAKSAGKTAIVVLAVLAVWHFVAPAKAKEITGTV